MKRRTLLLFGCTMFLVVAGASATTYDYELTAPGDFSEASFSIETLESSPDDDPANPVSTLHDMTFRSDALGIWISFIDFEDKVIKLLSIEDRIHGTVYAYLGAAGAAERGTEPKGEILGGTEIHFDDDQKAHGVIMMRLHPVGERGWIEGKPISIKLSFAGIEQAAR